MRRAKAPRALAEQPPTNRHSPPLGQLPRVRAAPSESELIERYGVNLATLEAMYVEWRDHGKDKTNLEEKYLGTRKHNGQRFTYLVRKFLGVDTRKPSRLSVENQRLRAENEQLRARLRELEAQNQQLRARLHGSAALDLAG